LHHLVGPGAHPVLEGNGQRLEKRRAQDLRGHKAEARGLRLKRGSRRRGWSVVARLRGNLDFTELAVEADVRADRVHC
jgi:hypothetical protein